MENFFKHLKVHLSRRGALQDLIKGFMSTLSILRNEHSYRLLKHMSTFSTKPINDFEKLLQTHVTPYAFSHIQNQIKYIQQVTVLDELQYRHQVASGEFQMKSVNSHTLRI